MLSFMRSNALASLPLPLALRAFLERAALPVGDVVKAHKVLRAFSCAYVDLQPPPSSSSSFAAAATASSSSSDDASTSSCAAAR